MAAIRANRPKVGSVSWITEERQSAKQIVLSETEEFIYSARNEIDWLNEHMAEIFNGKQVDLVEILKTPGRLRGKTPRTVRKNNLVQERPPLLSIFSTLNGRPDSFKPLNVLEKLSTLQVADSLPKESTSKVSDLERKPSSATPESHSNKLCSPDHLDNNDQPQYQSLSPQTINPTHSAYIFNNNEMEIEKNEEGENFAHTRSSFPSPEQEQSRKTQLTPSVEAQPIVDFENNELAISQRQLYPSLRSATQFERRSILSSQNSTPPQKSPRDQTSAERSTSQGQRSISPQIQQLVNNQIDEVSQSDASSPIRPIVRKSSLNFASLPAREPITTKKSIGNHVSRLSQSDHSRTSYYARKTGENCPENTVNEEDYGTLGDSRMGNDSVCDDINSNVMRQHNKTSTQRLQDQISKLGQSQKIFRPSKSITGSNVTQISLFQPLQQINTDPLIRIDRISPKRHSKSPVEELTEDISMVDNSSNTVPEPQSCSSQPATLPNNNAVCEKFCADEEIRNGKPGQNPSSLAQKVSSMSPDHVSTASYPVEIIIANHVKSPPTSDLSSPQKFNNSLLHRNQFSVSNPDQSVALNLQEKFDTLPKSSSQNHHGSPLKAAKEKFSMVLKTSKFLFTSSAVAGVELTSSSDSPTFLENQVDVRPQSDALNLDVSDPNLSHCHEPPESEEHHLLSKPVDSLVKISPRKTRSSSEQGLKRKEEEARSEKLNREIAVLQKLENHRESVRTITRDETYLNNLKQKRAIMLPQGESITSKTTETQIRTKQDDGMRATRTSPRKTKVQVENENFITTLDQSQDTDMLDSSHGVPTPILPRPKAQIGRPTSKRPLKPAKEATKVKPPTVIRVDTGSQRGHQYHPSNATLSATLKESLSNKSTVASHRLRNRTSTSSAQSKSSTNSFKAAATKTLEAAARKKEQDELAANRKREAKLELERQRAAIREEERRKEEKRRHEIEYQREIQREKEKTTTNSDIKKASSRQAVEKRKLELERAKEIRPPQPYVREKALVDLEKAPATISASEISYLSKTPGTVQKVQLDQARPITSSIISNARIPPKRPLQQENDDHHLRPTIQRNGASNQRNEQQMKRHKTNDFDDDEEFMKNRSKMTAPPIRQSSIRQKEISTKSLFSNGYVNAAPPANLQRSTLLSQHHTNQPKVTYPLDILQLAKGPIPFASSHNQGNSQTHKTPGRPSASNSGGKSITKPGLKTATKSSPRYPNGETIELPEIHTDSDDEDSENEGGIGVRPGWTDTPEIQKQLAYQESIDPTQVFGQPGPLNMEEVFSKSKDRFHKFRARTSSANWSGTDKLTEDEIQRDLEGRNRVRRQGGWTYDAMV